MRARRRAATAAATAHQPRAAGPTRRARAPLSVGRIEKQRPGLLTHGASRTHALTSKLRCSFVDASSPSFSPLLRPPQAQVEIGSVAGKLTDQNPLDRVASLRVAVEIQDVGVLPIAKAIELLYSTKSMRQEVQVRLRETVYPPLAGCIFNASSGPFRVCNEQHLFEEFAAFASQGHNRLGAPPVAGTVRLRFVCSFACSFACSWASMKPSCGRVLAHARRFGRPLS